MRVVAAALSVVLAAGCASFDGHTLVPGRATRAEVLELMGPPAEEATAPDGGAVLYFPRLPVGRQTFVARIGKDGVLAAAVEPRLTRENFARLVSGTTSAKEVRELLGPPSPPVVRFDRLQRDVWEYPYQYYEERRVVWVQFSYDGVVQEVLDMLDWSAYPPSGRRRR